VFLSSVPHFTAYLFIKLALNVRQHGAAWCLSVIVVIIVCHAVCALTILNMLREPHVPVAYDLDFSPLLSNVRRCFMVFLVVQIVLDKSCVPGGRRTCVWHLAFSTEVLNYF
jgi:hypothetical protein